MMPTARMRLERSCDGEAMTPAELKRLRELCDAASREWARCEIAVCGGANGAVVRDFVAKTIVATPKLIAEVERLQKVAEAARLVDEPGGHARLDEALGELDAATLLELP